jgi:GT2 family glycosyltransferase
LAEIDIAEKILSSLDKLPAKTILGCKLLDDNNEFQQSIWIEEPGIVREWKKGAINCKLKPNWQKNKAEKIAKIHDNSDYVNRINGAFLVFKKPKNITEVLFDEEFFLYGEDIEWAIRLKRNSWKFYHDCSIQINHIGSASSSNQVVKLNQIEIMDWLVVRKTKSKLYFQLFIFLIGFNFWLDLFLAKRKSNQSQINTVQEAQNNFKYLKKKYFKLIRDFNRELFFNELNEYKNDKKNIES